MLSRPGREAIKNLSKETTTFTLAYAKKLQDTSLFKARLSNNGESPTQLLTSTDGRHRQALNVMLRFSD